MLLINDTSIERIVFHFNKKFLEDPSVPMWVIKHKGNTHYVHHVTSHTGFTTKETPDNVHTKGSIMFRGKLQINAIKEDDNEQLTAEIF